MSVRVGVVTFPGSLDDRDTARAIRRAGGEPVALWHADAALPDVDAVVLPGGFSYGDYLRAGAIARFAAVMDVIVDAARGGLPVLGICNGFQVLCESHLLPGALVVNSGRKFVCRPQEFRIENAGTSWTNTFHAGQEVVMPIKNMDGCFVADDKTLDELEGEGRVVARYLVHNPNGSYRDIAGITNKKGNIVGLMPHPEHATDALTGTGEDGLGMFGSIVAQFSGHDNKPELVKR